MKKFPFPYILQAFACSKKTFYNVQGINHLLSKKVFFRFPRLHNKLCDQYCANMQQLEIISQVAVLLGKLNFLTEVLKERGV